MPLLGDFGFGIVGKQEKNDCVVLESGDKYKLKLWNFKTRFRCDAEVKIDDKVVGFFRIDKMNSIIIERPINDYGHFTFYTAETIEAKMAMLDAVDRNNLGLIEVTFYPEKKPIQQESYILENRDELESEHQEHKNKKFWGRWKFQLVSEFYLLYRNLFHQIHKHFELLIY